MKQNDKKIRVCLFDLDGTLISSMNAFARLAGILIERYYGVEKASAEKLYLESSGVPFFEQLEILFSGRSENSSLAREFEEKKIPYFFRERFSKDTLMTLKEIQKRGIKIGVSSNNFQELVEKFVKREKEICFDWILGYKKGFSKGAEHFEFIQKKSQLCREEILFIGDSLKDREKAGLYGTGFVAKLGTFSKEDFLSYFPNQKFAMIHFLSELLEIL